MKYLKLREAVEATGLHPNTLRKYADAKVIPVIKTPSGQRLFDIESFVGKSRSEAVICYARVSSKKQASDLDRQVAYLKDLYPDAEVITDIGSGLNFKRPGLKAILERSLRGDKLLVVVAHRDRLCRFGFDLVSWLLATAGGSVLVLNDEGKSSPEAELTSDLLAVIGVFSARLHGLRKYRHQISADPDLSKE